MSRRFPIMDAPTLSSVPWALIEPHEAQVQSNHDQSLTRLAERGGLTACEMLCAIQGRSIRDLLRSKSHGHRGSGSRRVELCECIEELALLALDHASAEAREHDLIKTAASQHAANLATIESLESHNSGLVESRRLMSERRYQADAERDQVTSALRALVDYVVLRDACVGCGENLDLSRCRFHCDECTPGEPETISDEPLRAAQELLKRLESR